MKKYKTVITTINGVYESDETVEEITPEVYDTVIDFFKNVKYMENLSAIINGEQVWFHPDNIISLSFVEVKDEEPA